MSSLNIVTLDGYITKDCELKKFTNENMVASFTLAINSYDPKAEDKTRVSFIDCKKYGKVDKISSYLNKGTKVTISGSLIQERWEKGGQKYSKLVVYVNQLTLQSVKNRQEENYGHTEYNPPVKYDEPVPEQDVQMEDEKDIF